MKKHIKSVASGFRVSEEIQPLHHGVDVAMAAAAKRYKIVHRMVLGIARDALSHPVNMVDAQLFCGPTFPAGVTISGHHSFLVTAKGSFVVKALSCPLPVFTTQRAILGSIGRVTALFGGRTLSAPHLRTCPERVWKAAVNAGPDRSDLNGACGSAQSLQGAHIQFSAGNRATRQAETLHRGGRLELFAASLANLIGISAASLTPIFHLTRFAPLRVPAVRGPLNSAVGAFDRLVIRDGSHSQNVAGVFANG